MYKEIVRPRKEKEKVMRSGGSEAAEVVAHAAGR